MSEEYRLIKSETVYSSRVFDLREDEVELPTGRVTQRISVIHPGAVVIIPKLDVEHLLLIRQYRHSIGKHILELPAGTLEKGEEPSACAEREIKEEVSYGAKNWTELGVLYPAPGFCDELQHGFLATELYPEDLPGDDDEIIEVVKMTIPEVEQAIISGEIVDAKSIAFYSKAKMMRLISIG